MKKREKSETVAFATSSGFAVVQGVDCPANEKAAEPVKSRPSGAKPMPTRQAARGPLQAR
jgi:hypothetical protein